MLDFTGVTAITIPEGSVKKITRGATVLWQKPEPEQQDYIVVFPETTLTGRYSEKFDSTDFYFDLNRIPNAGEQYNIYFNGQKYTGISKIVGGAIELYPYEPWVSTTDMNTTNVCIAMEGNVPTATIEIHYIPKWAVVFPATTFTASDGIVNGWINEINMKETPVNGDTYAVVFNGTEYNYVAEVRGSMLEICITDDFYLAIGDYDGTNKTAYCVLYGTFDSVTIEIRRMRY